MSGQESKRHPEIDRYGGFDTAKRERKDCAGEKLTARKLGTPPPKQNVSNEWHKDEKVDPPWMSQESKVCHIVRHGRIMPEMSEKAQVVDVISVVRALCGLQFAVRKGLIRVLR